jgi:hypothetical protein
MLDHKPRVEENGDNLATLGEARRATISRERLGDVKDFWPGFAAAVGKKGSTKHVRIGARFALQWALGAAGLLVVIGVSVLAPRLFRRGGPPAAPEKTAVIFRIDSVKINEEPAQAFVFQTQDQGSTFVWVEKQL